VRGVGRELVKASHCSGPIDPPRPPDFLERCHQSLKNVIPSAFLELKAALAVAVAVDAVVVVVVVVVAVVAVFGGGAVEVLY